MASGDLLTDGEPLAFKRLNKTQMSISNRFPQTTGFSRLRDGRFVLTAFFPEDASSRVLLLAADGTTLGAERVPAYVRLVDVLPNGDLLMLRILGEQELAIYRLR